MKKALDDIVVLDFTRYIAGPFATYLLGHMGARIIKVEKAIVGEDFRLYPPFYNGESLAYPAYASNKKSLCMDLRNDRAKEILLKLLPHVDIVVQNFRAGTIEKMGLDWETIHRINPRIIMANNSGFGQYGPYSKRVAFDSIIQSESGLISSVAEEGDGTPYYPGGNNSDHMGALAFVSAIMSALLQRDRTGEGQYLEVDMMSAVSSMFSPELAMYEATGRIEKTNDLAPCAYYKDKSGRFVQISCPNALWEDLKAALGTQALSDSRFSTPEGRRENKAELDRIVGEWVAERDADELIRALESRGIGAAVVRDYKDIINNEQVKAMHFLRELEVPYVGKAPYPDIPFRLSASPIEFGRIPKIGEDNYDVLHEYLGMSMDEVISLTEAGILYQAEHAQWK